MLLLLLLLLCRSLRRTRGRSHCRRRRRSSRVRVGHVRRVRWCRYRHLRVADLSLGGRVRRMVRHVRVCRSRVDRLMLRRHSGLSVHLRVRLVAHDRLVYSRAGRHAVDSANRDRALLADAHGMNRDRRWRSRGNRDWYNRRCRHRRNTGGRRRLNGNG